MKPALTTERLDAVAQVDAPAALVLASASARGVLRVRRYDVRYHGGIDHLRKNAAEGDRLAKDRLAVVDAYLGTAREMLAVRRQLMGEGVRVGEHGTDVEAWNDRTVPNPHWPHLDGHGLYACVRDYRGNKRTPWQAEVHAYLPDEDRTQFVTQRLFTRERAARRWAILVARAAWVLVQVVERENTARGAA